MCPFPVYHEFHREAGVRVLSASVQAMETMDTDEAGNGYRGSCSRGVLLGSSVSCDTAELNPVDWADIRHSVNAYRTEATD